MRQSGVGTSIHPSAELSGDYLIGDHCIIGPDVRITASPFVLGDYSKIHRGTFIYTQNDVFPGGYVLLGHNTWIGQNCVIDGSGGLRAGDNLGVGIGSQLYTHISNGDWSMGSRFHGVKPMRIGNDVWFVGCCFVSPVTAGSRSMAMLGSVVVNDMSPNTVYGGNPAREISALSPAYEKPDVEKRASAVRGFAEECFGGKIPDSIVIVEDGKLDKSIYRDLTVICMRTRRYWKRGTPEEVRLLKYLNGFRAKLTPYQSPSSQLHDAALKWEMAQ